MSAGSLRRCGILLALLAFGSVVAAERVAFAPDALMRHVRYLASDELGGRGNGTPGLERAADYIAAQFQAAGLKPGGEGGSWFQRFELITGIEIGTGNRLALRRGRTTVSLRLGETYYPLSANANDDARVPSAEVDAVPLVFAGYGISAPALGYDDYAGLDASGKAVLVFTHEPQERDPKSRFDGRSPSEHGSLMNKAMAARAHGARLLLVVSDPAHEGDSAGFRAFARDPQADDYGIPVLRVHRTRIAPLLQAWNLDTLARQIDGDLRPRSRPLDGTVTYRQHLAKVRRTVRNVIGVLPGSDPRHRDEAIVVGAHYDHLGSGGRHSMSPELMGQIHNGADDNASGTAAIIEIARAAATHRGRFPRSVVLAAFAGEELGLLGSAHYVDKPVVALDRTIAMLNLDMIGRPEGRILVSGLESAPDLEADMDAAAAAVPGVEVRRFREGAGVGSSDDTSFSLRRVPAIAFFSGFHGDYHRPSDDWDRIDGEGTAHVASLAFELASRIASRATRPAYAAPAAPAHTAGGSPGPGTGGYGAYFGSVPDFADSDAGVKFADVRENSPAAKAGLRAGDLLVSFDGRPIRNLYDFTFALREKKPGDDVAVEVLRNGQPLNVKVVLGVRP